LWQQVDLSFHDEVFVFALVRGKPPSRDGRAKDDDGKSIHEERHVAKQALRIFRRLAEQLTTTRPQAVRILLHTPRERTNVPPNGFEHNPLVLYTRFHTKVLPCWVGFQQIQHTEQLPPKNSE
jgi:hypothetical protein